MGETVVIQRIGECCGIMLPQEHLERVGWKEGDRVGIRSDTVHIEFVTTKTTDGNGQHTSPELIASVAMRNYYAALRALAKH